MARAAVIAIMAAVLIIDVYLSGLFAGIVIWVTFGGAGYFIGRYFPLWPR